MLAFLQPFRFAWTATRRHHLRPWRSPLLRWRIETYSGVPAEAVSLGVFLRFCWRERSGLIRFLGWTAEMRGHRNRGRHPGISAQAGP